MPRKTVYKSAKHGRFVTKKFAKQNPNTTVKETVCDLRQELIDFANEVFVNPNDQVSTEELVDSYLKEK